MSQAKVDRNKEQKRNVKKIMAQEKRNWMLTQIVLLIIGAAVVIWLVVSLYQAVKAPFRHFHALNQYCHSVHHPFSPRSWGKNPTLPLHWEKIL